MKRSLIFTVLRIAVTFSCIIMAVMIISYRNGSIFADKISNLSIDISGETYIQTKYVGAVGECLYYAVETTRDTESPVNTDIYIVCTDRSNNLVFQTFVSGGFFFSIIKDKIYVPVTKRNSEEASYGYKVYDLKGNYLAGAPVPGIIGTCVPIKDKIYAVLYPKDAKSFTSRLWNIHDNADTIELDFSFSMASPLPDGTAVIFGRTGYIDGISEEYQTGIKMIRTDGDKVLWDREVPDILLTGGNPPTLVSDSRIFIATAAADNGGVKEMAYILDFDGNLIEASGIPIGLDTVRKNYRYQLADFFADKGCWDVLLWGYELSFENRDNISNYILQLNSEGSYLSRGKLAFKAWKSVIGILEGEDDKRIFLTAEANGENVTLGMYKER